MRTEQPQKLSQKSWKWKQQTGERPVNQKMALGEEKKMALGNSLITQNTKKQKSIKEMNQKLRSSKICLIGVMEEQKEVAEK